MHESRKLKFKQAIGIVRQCPNLRMQRLSGRRCAAACNGCNSDQTQASVEVLPEKAFSALIREEVLLFLVQMEFDRQLQRALNYENAEAADTLRSRRDALNRAVQKFQDTKGTGDGARNARQPELADFAAEGLRMRSELQRAVDDERYQDATRIQSQLKELQATSQAAASAAADLRGADRLFRLGQRVVHRAHGYRAVVCGWDVQCCEDETWQTENGILDEPGVKQTFYHLLVDSRDWDDVPPDSAIVYVSEAQLVAPQEYLGITAKDDMAEGQIQHPYNTVLFLGMDHAGDMLPTRRLRQKYSARRRDVGPTTTGVDEEDEPPSSADSSDGPDSDGPSGRDFGSMRVL